MTIRSLSYALTGLCAVTLMAGCKHGEKPAQETAKPTKNIQVATVHAESYAEALRIPGRVEADPQKLVHVYAPLSGRLLSMTLTPGQEVRKGQVVATLQSGDVAQARTDFEKAKIESLRADHALERGTLLASHEVLSQADLQELQATAGAARAERERTRQRVHELGFSENGTSDVTVVTSPISGTVLDIGSATGEMQRSLETSGGIATIADLNHVWVTGDLYEQDLHRVHPQDAVDVTFSAYPGETFVGKVASIGDAFDPGTHAVKLRVVLANPQHRLKPGMFATLSVAQQASTRIFLPQAAVLHDGDATIVYVAAADGKYVVRRVSVGAVVGERVEINEGLHEGDRVVTTGAALLREPAGD